MPRRTIHAVVATAGAAAAAAVASGPPIGNASPYLVQTQPAPASCHARGHGAYALPDRRCTPGAINPAVTASTLSRTICRAGYTRSIRPPESVTEPEKRASMVAYGDRGPLHAYEYDHLIPLELGGARNDARNLWPQARSGSDAKLRLENRLNAMVCDHAIALSVAQQAIAVDWVAAYHRYLP